jgi:hypothetical protein
MGSGIYLSALRYGSTLIFSARYINGDAGS